MAFYHDCTLVLGLSAAILLITAWGYWRVAKPYAQFPTFWAVPHIIWLQLTGKIPSNISATEFFFQYFADAIESYRPEGLFVMWLPYPYVIVLTEQAAKTFLHSEVCIDKPAAYDATKAIFGKGLLTSSGDIWMKHRKMLNPVFHTDMLKSRLSTFNECADALVKELSEAVDKSHVDIFEYLKLCSFHVVLESILGLKGVNKQNKETLRIMANKVRRMTEITAYKPLIPWWKCDFIFNLTSVGKEYKKLCDDWDNFTGKVISDMKKSVASRQPEAEATHRTEDRKSFTRILLDYSLDDPSFTLKDVEDQVKTFMAAGYDTVSTGAMWCLYMLGLHPDMQEQVYNEVMSVADEFVTYEQLCELKYLERVIMETLRLYPPAPVMARELKRDVQFEKYKVPKGTTMVFSIYAQHRNPETFPDPEKFDADRFIGGSSGKQPYSYMPFAEGKRNCIGKKFAMLEMKVILSHVLRNFKITSLKKRENIKLYWLLTLMPTQPIFLQLTPRESLQ